MPNFAFPRRRCAEITRSVRLQIVQPSTRPPDGDGWPHEDKHDGHRLLAIIAGGDITLISRYGYDRTAKFREPFGRSPTPDCPL